MIRIPYEKAFQTLKSIHLKHGYNEERAQLSSNLFCQANRDGVLSHGFARFPNLIGAIESGKVIPQNSPVQTWSGGALERWDGQLGPGNLSAYAAMDRAMELSEQYGMGAVALSNTNHWMRGGNFGWQAAAKGKIAICWTNTTPNMTAWGSDNALVGNNPLVIAIPREEGPVVLDMAMSQYSNGAVAGYAAQDKKLPYPGGWDKEGELTTDPKAIVESGRTLPIGFWKGSGLAMALDLTAALLAGGKATCEIPPSAGADSGICQVFMAFDPPEHPGLVDRVVESLKVDGGEVFYPGEQTLKRREESDQAGLAVSEDTWNKVVRLL